MKKISAFFSLGFGLLLTQSPAFAGVFSVPSTGEAQVETYILHVYDAWGRPIARENEEPRARERAMDRAKANARKAFEEICRNSKNGIPSRINAYLSAAPGDSSPCVTEWESSSKGLITCTARAQGTCTIRDTRDIRDARISDQSEAPSRVEVVDGVQYLIDESGVAHPIAGSAR